MNQQKENKAKILWLEERAQKIRFQVAHNLSSFMRGEGEAIKGHSHFNLYDQIFC